MRIVALLCYLAISLSSAFGADEPRRPNVILIYVDEMRWADVAPSPTRTIPTPHIDALAAEGVRCVQAYTSTPWCSPSRAGLLTGRYPQRFGHEFNPNQPGQRPEWGLPTSEITLADYVRPAGYATGVFGKWHLGRSDQLHPNRRGSDNFFGFIRGAHSYVDANDPRLGLLQRNGTVLLIDVPLRLHPRAHRWACPDAISDCVCDLGREHRRELKTLIRSGGLSIFSKLALRRNSRRSKAPLRGGAVGRTVRSLRLCVATGPLQEERFGHGPMPESHSCPDFVQRKAPWTAMVCGQIADHAVRALTHRLGAVFRGTCRLPSVEVNSDLV